LNSIVAVASSARNGSRVIYDVHQVFVAWSFLVASLVVSARCSVFIRVIETHHNQASMMTFDSAEM
jgi:hypothetical protein